MSQRAKHATLRAMKRTLLIAACMLLSLAARAEDSRLGYDPQADPFEQYHAAIAEARDQDKLVLIIAGGDWCTWCHSLDKFLRRDEDVRRNLDAAFVVMKVYVGDENYNRDFFSQLPEARGAPHFWIVSPEKRVLASQSTGEFERQGRGYDRNEVLAFIERWKKHEGVQGP
jgi:Thioredoxin-like